MRFLEAIGVQGKVLILTDGVKHNVVLSSRNVPTILVRPFGGESTYDILWSGTVVVERTVLGEAAGSGGEAPADPRAGDGGIAAASEGGEEADA